VTCLCERDTLEACRQEGLPAGILAHIDRACRVLEKLPGATSKKAQRVLGKALRQWRAVGQLLERPKTAAKMSDQCRDVLEAFVADAAARAIRMRDEVGGRRGHPS